MRRSFFILTTFALYRFPMCQAQAMLVTTVVYLCYISQQGFYLSPFQKRVEIVNEGLLVCLCLNFILFTDTVIWMDSQETMFKFGRSACAIVLILLGGNTLIIMAINFKRIKLIIKKKLNQRAYKRSIQ